MVSSSVLSCFWNVEMRYYFLRTDILFYRTYNYCTTQNDWSLIQNSIDEDGMDQYNWCSTRCIPQTHAMIQTRYRSTSADCSGVSKNREKTSQHAKKSDNTVVTFRILTVSMEGVVAKISCGLLFISVPMRWWGGSWLYCVCLGEVPWDCLSFCRIFLIGCPGPDSLWLSY